MLGSRIGKYDLNSPSSAFATASTSETIVSWMLEFGFQFSCTSSKMGSRWLRTCCLMIEMRIASCWK